MIIPNALHSHNVIFLKLLCVETMLILLAIMVMLC